MTADVSPQSTVGKAEALYEQLKHDRDPFLDRARECCKYTLPTLLVDEHHTKDSKIHTPYQGVGARGVNNLASRLLMALFPPNSPFFRFIFSDKATQEAEQMDEEIKTKLEVALGKAERAIMKFVEMSGDRIAQFSALKHLLVVGNVLCFLPTNERMQIFPLDRYVVKRDASGNVLHIITKECVAPIMLPEEVRDLIVNEKEDSSYTQGDSSNKNKTINIYTHIRRLPNGSFETYQEARGVVLPKSKGKYPKDKSPYIPLRGSEIPGEDYGRSYVEEYLGDLKTLEALTKALTEGTAAAAKMLIMVRPGSSTKKKDVAKAKNGAIITGSDEDVSVLQANKFNDFRTADMRINSIEERLSFAFLLNTAIQRQAERVTAEEIRYMANELETTLGGLYSILSQEFQLPYINRKILQMQKQKKLEPFPKDVVQPVIVTGLEALGRGNDLSKLDLFLQGMMNIIPPEVIAQYVNIGDYVKRRATAVGIDTEGLIKTEEQMAQEAAQAQQQVQQQQLTPELIKQAGPIISKAMEGQMPEDG